MTLDDVVSIIEHGETSKVQFKLKITSPDALAAEYCAFANSQGGILLVGVEDASGAVKGLSKEEIRKTNTLLSNVAQNNVNPPVMIMTDILMINKKAIIVVEIQEGLAKPYMDNKGIAWVKNGPDKRKVTDRLEFARLLQQGRNLFADEMPVQEASIDEIDKDLLDIYFLKTFESSVDEFSALNKITYNMLIKNLHLLSGHFLNLAGLLLFGKNPQHYKPVFIIKAVSFFGNDITNTEYRDSEDIAGNLAQQFKNGIAFIMRNIRKIQKDQHFNSIGVPEISRIALEELLQNALIHRDYFKNAPVRILIFDNRIEIISPGKLPNNLTVENIILGNTVIRNNIITSFASKLLPYRGLGTGIRRALKKEKDLQLHNDTDGDQFIVTIPRPLLID
ncbi:MAG: putative DNA binding domain-containing protein [Spirochaetales bacterium]|nr:putative DNA binding domain-containing protein [Spirochaetales bacterium]